MGARNSKPDDNLQPSRTSQELQVYSKSACDALLATRLTLLKLKDMQTVRICVLLDDEDKKTWSHLCSEKDSFVGEIQVFAESTGLRLREVRRRIGTNTEDNNTLSQCYRSFGVNDTTCTIEKLQTKCQDLKRKFKDFQEHIQEKYNYNREVALRVGSFATAFLAAIGVAVLVVLHFVPGVNIALGTAELVALVVVGGGLVVGCGAYALSKSEVQRAQEFLKSIQQRLGDLRNSMSNIRANGDLLSMLERTEAQECLDQITHQCDIIVQICREL
mmetsp:Transcript_6218/g.12586  ORF Transcript_6218/g.12586 Transcript_6218/m.12586 type:complete len:274 (-) Transcript_6218:150-971(-)|eukprot:CAMPEP_0196748448 /NCGR_PEP_ID=MMETSP1091-20130531/73405_1 /TAXON_ID=302021 /ORGANISM="Rhodomonas sp., Strain CCMP768" /LENGTH=273 /DNA_ID=CAMNT_0042095767 /DNA_START=96 /DNA_END=917 /DNA_ORIENTATION=+